MNKIFSPLVVRPHSHITGDAMKQVLKLLVLVLISTTAWSMKLVVNTEDFKSAQEQQDEEWLQVSSEPYIELPEITGPSLGEAMELLDLDFNKKAFTENGNTMNGRTKHIHKFGTVATVRFVAEDNIFTGIFSSGAEHAILRLSLAMPEENAGWFSNYNITPGFAIRFYIDYQAPLSTLAMPSLGGQQEASIFSFEYKNNLPKPPCKFKLKVIERSFEKSLAHQGQKNGNPRHLTSDDMASVNTKGEMINNFKAPYELIYTPTIEARNLMREHEISADFRATLANKGKGAKLFNVYALEYKDGPRHLLGYIEATSNFVASKNGDEMFFKHPKCHDKY